MNPFVFLVGCPRSGTTLLQRMVDAHPEIEIIAELARLSDRFTLREGLTDDGCLTPALIRSLFDEGFGRYVGVPIGRAEADEMARRRVSYADFYACFFDRHGEMRGKRLVGNKSVREVQGIAVLHELWPHAKFVHLIRDGRDVALSAMSWRRAEKLAARFPIWRDDPVSTAAAWWEWHVRPGRDAGRPLGPELYHEIRYESLVARPADEMRHLCAFLGIRYDDAMLRFHEGRTRAESGLDAKHGWLPPTPGLRDWRTDMPGDDVERFEAVAGDLLAELGYPRSVAALTGERLEHAACVRRAFEESVHTYLSTRQDGVSEDALRAQRGVRASGAASGER